MANDREVLRIIWEGQIPICFQADLDEANAVRQPENFYLMVSRLSYLPLVTDKVNIDMQSQVLFNCFFYLYDTSISDSFGIGKETLQPIRFK